LHNACKFTVDGEITIDWKIEEQIFIFKVADTGCGIPEEFQDKVFESFWQVDMGMGRKYGGTGLGLTVTKQFVELLRGEIRLDSKDSDGSVFTINIPLQN
jgi:signal transduction histidine kinase